MSAGLDRETLRPLSGWVHVVQSVRVILSTRIGERVMRRTFGASVNALLGRENMTPSALLRFATAIAIALELWEPRFRLRAMEVPSDQNSAPKLRQGQLGLRLVGDYRPRALEGDFTIERPEAIDL